MFAIPVHPAIVHFPLAFLFAAWICVLALHWRGDGVWRERAGLFELVGVLTAPIAIVAGFVDAGELVFVNPEWDQPLVWHALASLTATALFTWHWTWARRLEPQARQSAATLDVAWTTAATWLYVLSGLIAAEMVYGA